MEIRPKPPIEDREFIDNFLEFGIGHYYRICQILVHNFEKMTDSERRSAALEIHAAASSTLELVITWFYALREWHSASGQAYLVDVLHSTELSPSKRKGALRQVRKSSLKGFCDPLGIECTNKDLIPQGIDPSGRRAEIKLVIEAITQIFGQMDPVVPEARPDWMMDCLNTIKHGLVLTHSEYEGSPSVKLLTSGSQPVGKDGLPAIYEVRATPEAINTLVEIAGNGSIALGGLIRLVYLSKYKSNPISSVVRSITDDLYGSSPGV